MAIGGGFDGPGHAGVAVTPSDTTDLTGVRGVYVGGTGNLVVQFINPIGNANSITLSAVPAGTILPLQVAKIMAATTATLIVGLY